jgi:flagellar protein FliO/FliZ
MKLFRSTCAAALAAALSLTGASAAGAYAPSKADSAESTPLHLGTGSTTSATHTASSATGAGIVRTLVGLVIVVALIYAITWVLRKVKRGESRKVGTSLESIASLPLGPGRSLALVRAGSELVLVGVAEHQVTAIRRYTEDEARAAGLIADEDDELGPRIDTLTSGRAGTLATSMGGDAPRTDWSKQGLVDTLRRWTVRS